MEKLTKICKFEKGCYYTFLALVRAKDYNDKCKPILSVQSGGQLLVRHWLIDSEEKLLKYMPDMIALCNSLKCRLYMTTDKKSVVKTLSYMSKQLNDFILNLVISPQNLEQFSIRRLNVLASASQSEETSCHNDRKWLIDCDLNKVADKTSALNMIEKISNATEIYNRVLLKTPNGFHIVCDRKMEIGSFLQHQLDMKELPDWIETKSNALTLLYFNKGE